MGHMEMALAVKMTLVSRLSYFVISLKRVPAFRVSVDFDIHLGPTQALTQTRLGSHDAQKGLMC